MIGPLLPRTLKSEFKKSKKVHVTLFNFLAPLIPFPRVSRNIWMAPYASIDYTLSLHVARKYLIKFSNMYRYSLLHSFIRAGFELVPSLVRGRRAIYWELGTASLKIRSQGSIKSQIMPRVKTLYVCTYSTLNCTVLYLLFSHIQTCLGVRG